MPARSLPIVALLIVVAAIDGHAAFEAPDDDPARLALASSGPAWPVNGPASADNPAVFGSAPAPGIAFSTLRWEAAPGLTRDAVTGSIRFRSVGFAARVARLSCAAYSEMRAGLGVVRPAAGAGWGWGAGFGRESWSAGASGRAGWFFSGTLGYAPRPEFRVALRVLERGGPAAASSQNSVEIGGTADPVPGWRLGFGYETARTGGFGRFRLGVECRACRSLVLRTGFAPSDDSFSAGLGFDRGTFGVDIARRSHPRLGWLQAIAFRAGGKRGGAW